MSWIQKLYETYGNCQTEIGKVEDEERVPLLPICHTTQKAHVQITINSEGKILRASVIPKGRARTIIPCTESSGGRASGPRAHPLCDKLQYVAGDYQKYAGNKESYFELYQEQLSAWCASIYHPKVEAILKYIKKKHVIYDLIDKGALHLGNDGKLLQRWEDRDTKAPDIFSMLPGRMNKKGEIETWQADAFIRWAVEIPGDPQSDVCSDRDIWQSWIKYYSSQGVTKGLCYVTGQCIPVAEQHPSKIRNDGDKAKLISSGKTKGKDGNDKVDDSLGFAFLGKFTNSKQACSVGYEVSQKAHSALRWLISKQGFRNGDQAVVAWATSGIKIPDPIADTLGLFDDMEASSEITSANSTAQHLAISLSKLIAGYRARLGPTDGIVVMGMDSATPGRLSITFYRELTGSDFLERVLNWHTACAWWLVGKDKSTEKPLHFVGAPAPKDIAWAAYGRRMDDKLRKTAIERILPCIVDGVPLPRDIVQSTVRHTCNRLALESWEWEKALGITCSVFKHYHNERRYEMALETDRCTRDYLFGRLLAAADCLEGFALFLANEKRETGTARLMQRFSDHPCSTWKTIELSLSPYKMRLGGRAVKYQKVIDEVMCAFNTDDFISDKPLSGEFLIGYHCQRKDLWPSGQGAIEGADGDMVNEHHNEEVL